MILAKEFFESLGLTEGIEILEAKNNYKVCSDYSDPNAEPEEVDYKVRYVFLKTVPEGASDDFAVLSYNAAKAFEKGDIKFRELEVNITPERIWLQLPRFANAKVVATINLYD